MIGCLGTPSAAACRCSQPLADSDRQEAARAADICRPCRPPYAASVWIQLSICATAVYRLCGIADGNFSPAACAQASSRASMLCTAVCLRTVLGPSRDGCSPPQGQKLTKRKVAEYLRTSCSCGFRPESCRSRSANTSAPQGGRYPSSIISVHLMDRVPW